MPRETPASEPINSRSPLRLIWDLLSETYKGWRKDNAQTLGAALAFYATFSIAPVLIIVIAVFGVILGKETVQVEILRRTQDLIGTQGADAVGIMIRAAYRPGSGLNATIIGILVIVIGSTSALVMLKQALNIMWGVETAPMASVWNLIKGRLLSFIMILVIGLLLMLSMMVSVALSFVSAFLENWVPVPIFFIQMSDWGLSILLVTLLFAMVFKILPDVKIPWSDVWVGSIFTAILFTLGKFLFALYLARSSISSAYGAASSLAIILVWVYYSAQVLLFGAELTQVYSSRHGSRAKTI
jgi:membrane protein